MMRRRLSRNYGFERAKGDFFVVFDSDIIVPQDYLNKVRAGINQENLDAFGGPDAAHTSFTAIQKAISYSMTSPFTTGGIRGNKKHVGQFHPRSFNLGISRQVWEETGGFKLSRRSEDIEFSMDNQGTEEGQLSSFVFTMESKYWNIEKNQNIGFDIPGAEDSIRLDEIDFEELIPHREVD